MLKERFIDFLRFEKRFSPHTIQSYRTDLGQFEGYLSFQYNIIDIALADHLMIRSWIVSLLEQKLSPRSINRKLSTLKSFFHFCLRIGVVTSNPTLKVTSPKVSRHLPVFIEKEKLETLFRDVDFGSGFESFRDRLMIMMLYATGIRRSELIGIRMPDLDLAKSTLKVMGKRSKERIIPLGSYLCSQTEIYMKERDSLLNRPAKLEGEGTADFVKKMLKVDSEIDPQENNHDLLFVSEKGHKLNARNVYEIIHKYLSLISSQSKLSPHVLRHSFATHMLNDGADLNSIKELLGHTSLAATQVYTHNTIEKLKLIYKQAHPRA
ncbi:MAG: tyrosine-type recombinase/integrase [Bacteroidetes bacterium]|nr:tyrosine-type recombinase/integrase [Bacteroidota bacterium]